MQGKVAHCVTPLEENTSGPMNNIFTVQFTNNHTPPLTILFLFLYSQQCTMLLFMKMTLNPK